MRFRIQDFLSVIIIFYSFSIHVTRTVQPRADVVETPSHFHSSFYSFFNNILPSPVVTTPSGATHLHSPPQPPPNMLFYFLPTCCPTEKNNNFTMTRIRGDCGGSAVALRVFPRVI